MIMNFRKKPVVVQAIQYIWQNKKEVIDFTNGLAHGNAGFNHLTIPTLEGNMMINVNDWVIKGVKGEFYPCKPDIFEETYDECS